MFEQVKLENIVILTWKKDLNGASASHNDWLALLALVGLTNVHKGQPKQQPF
jgi:hypothetical protein